MGTFYYSNAGFELVYCTGDSGTGNFCYNDVGFAALVCYIGAFSVGNVVAVVAAIAAAVQKRWSIQPNNAAKLIPLQWLVATLAVLYPFFVISFAIYNLLFI